MVDCLERPKCKTIEGGNYSPDYYLCPLPPPDWVPATQFPAYKLSVDVAVHQNARKLRERTYFTPDADENIRTLLAKANGRESCLLGLWGCWQVSTAQEAQEEIVYLMEDIYRYQGRKVEYNYEDNCFDPPELHVFTQGDVALAARYIDASKDTGRDWWMNHLGMSVPHYTATEIAEARNKLREDMESANRLWGVGWGFLNNGTMAVSVQKTCYWDHCAGVFLCEEK